MKNILPIRASSVFLLASALAVSGTALADQDRQGPASKAGFPAKQATPVGKIPFSQPPVRVELPDAAKRPGRVEPPEAVKPPTRVELPDAAKRPGHVEPPEADEHPGRVGLPKVPQPQDPADRPGVPAQAKELHARLTDAATTVKAEAEFKAKPTKTVFEGNVRVSLPAYGIDPTNVSTSPVTLTLSRMGAPYAECTLALRSFKQNALGASASYRVVAASHDGTLTELPAGAACDDLASGNPAVPAVQPGDTLSLSINAIPVATGIIQ